MAIVHYQSLKLVGIIPIAFAVSMFVIPVSCLMAGSQDQTRSQLSPAANFLITQNDEQSSAEPLGESGHAETATSGNSFIDTIVNGKPIVDLRLRVEHVQQDGVEDATAATGRLRLGYQTNPWHGLSLLAELETVQVLNEDTYNHPGVGGNPGHAVIADPDDTELNRALLQYRADDLNTTFTFGRGRIILDNARFVGNVGWRQNEQTFDAITLESTPLSDLELFYGYIWDVNRIFGPEADLDFESDSHLFNAKYTLEPVGQLTGFVYLLNFSNSPTNSSNTFGFRLTGDQPIAENFALGYVGSYAHQIDAADNTTDYAAHYYNLELSLKRIAWGTLAVGY